MLDSTILADAVATQDTVIQLVAAIGRVRRLVPGAGGVELAAHGHDRAGKPDCVWDDPQATQALVSGLVNDALAVLAAVGDVGLDDEQAEAVALLALLAGQAVEPGTRPGSWRIARKVAKDRVISTYGGGRPARRCQPPATSRRSSRSHSRARCRWVHHPRLPHRPVSRHPQVPGGRDGADHQLRPGQLRTRVSLLPAASALHHRQGWPHHPPPPARRRAARRSPPGDHPQLPATLSTLAADGTLIAWLVADGCRRVPYRGIDRNDLWWSVRVAAVNLRRLLALGLARRDQSWVLA